MLVSFVDFLELFFGLFFLLLDKTSTPPLWLPTTHISFNYADYGLEQAIGAIKARVQEAGGVVSALTALQRAALAKQETQYLSEIEELRSPLGRETVRTNALKLFKTVERVCAEVSQTGSITIQFASDDRQCHLRDARSSLLVTLKAYSAAILEVREFDKKLAFRGENLLYMDGEPKHIAQSTFLPHINRAREYGWMQKGAPSSFLSPDILADQIVSRFVDLAAKAERRAFKLGGG